MISRFAPGCKPGPIARFVALAYARAMARRDFAHVTTWVFDLDNTLYPPEARLDRQKLFKKHLRSIRRPNPRYCIYKVGLVGDADRRRTVKGGDRLDINPTVIIQLSERI